MSFMIKLLAITAIAQLSIAMIYGADLFISEPNDFEEPTSDTGGFFDSIFGGLKVVFDFLFDLVKFLTFTCTECEPPIPLIVTLMLNLTINLAWFLVIGSAWRGGFSPS